jgi:hypothetical protein
MTVINMPVALTTVTNNVFLSFIAPIIGYDESIFLTVTNVLCDPKLANFTSY